MKKIISIAAAAAMLASFAGSALAADKTPTVYVNSSQIVFEDQEPVILGEGTTLIPARGVFEAMGATVSWNGEERLVTVEGADGKTVIKLTIDDSEMKVYATDLADLISTVMIGQDYNAPETIVTLDVAPQIINDRTMIPLRAISEALDAKVDWDGANYIIDITTADAPESKDGLPGYTLTAGADKVEAGETVDIFVNVENLPENTFVSAVTAVLRYNTESFEFVESAFVNGDEEIEGAIGGDNAEYGDGLVKALYLTTDTEKAVQEDGAVLKLTFKSIDGSEGEFAIVNSYDTQRGYDTTLETSDSENESTLYRGDTLSVNTTAVTVNAAE